MKKILVIFGKICIRHFLKCKTARVEWKLKFTIWCETIASEEIYIKNWFNWWVRFPLCRKTYTIFQYTRNYAGTFNTGSLMVDIKFLYSSLEIYHWSSKFSEKILGSSDTNPIENVCTIHFKAESSKHFITN